MIDSYYNWIKLGIKKGWCGPPICITHDGIPTTPEQDAELDGGHDPCINMIRIYEDNIEQLLVEDNHQESVWRKSNFINARP
jgi:hypothetical protein